MEVVVTGGTGLVGSALTSALVNEGYNVCILTRNPGKYKLSPGVRYARWDPGMAVIDADAIKRADHIIHLAGAGIADKRWSPKYKEEILRSRVQGSEFLVQSINKYAETLKSVVSASATGWYGEDISTHIFREDDPPADDFLGEVCRQWEVGMNLTGYPVAKLRTGIVFANNGGAYPKLTGPARFGIAVILGDGKQVVSWIHIHDLVRMYITAMKAGWNGSFNAVAPMPVTNRHLAIETAKKLKGKFFIQFYVPLFLLKLIVGGSAEEVIKSCTVSSEKVQAHGFTFLYPSLSSCLAELNHLKVAL